jgi:hypothetical protein
MKVEVRRNWIYGVLYFIYIMGKLGYTWYPKDWGNSESVFELSLSERGLYRELIDLAMLNDNKTEYKPDIWSRKFASTLEEINQIIKRLSEIGLIEIKDNILFISSCEKRLVFVRTGREGGKKSKPINKGISKGISKGINKGISNQREREREREINKDVYLSFDHLSITVDEYQKLISVYTQQQVNDIFDDIRNYKNNKSYKSLYLTAKKWLKKLPAQTETSEENKINFDILLKYFNDTVKPKVIINKIPESVQRRFNELVNSGITKDNIATAINNAAKDRVNRESLSIDMFSSLTWVNKYLNYKEDKL